MEYYYVDSHNQARGPVTLEQLRSLAVAGTLNAGSLVAPVGSQQWMPIGSVISDVAMHLAPATEPLAIWSFVMSLCSLLCCGLLLGIPGVICGHLALSNIGSKPYLQGKGFAIAGLIIGYISIAFWILYLAFFVVVGVVQGFSDPASS